jgi:hypothetical protein
MNSCRFSIRDKVPGHPRQEVNNLSNVRLLQGEGGQVAENNQLKRSSQMYPHLLAEYCDVGAVGEEASMMIVAGVLETVIGAVGVE